MRNVDYQAIPVLKIEFTRIRCTSAFTNKQRRSHTSFEHLRSRVWVAIPGLPRNAANIWKQLKKKNLPKRAHCQDMRKKLMNYKSRSPLYPLSQLPSPLSYQHTYSSHSSREGLKHCVLCRSLCPKSPSILDMMCPRTSATHGPASQERCRDKLMHRVGIAPWVKLT